MVTEPAFLEPDAVLYLHDQSIREWGGYHGLRDEALLASALSRPHDPHAYEPGSGLHRLGIAKNRAFLDGNKRTAWACCTLFLRLNGVRLQFPAIEPVETMVALAEGRVSEADFAAWQAGCANCSPPGG
jgi:death on curing protein